MDIVNDIKAEMAAMEKRKQEYMTSQKENLTNVFRAFLEKHEAVRAIVWDQFTPYFNDGDPCVFTAHDPGVVLDEDGEALEQWGLRHEIGKGERKGPEYPAILDDLKALESAMNGLDDLFLHAFGDHATVKVTREGVTVTECSHD